MGIILIFLNILACRASMQGQKSQIYNCGNSGRIVLLVITNFTNYLQSVKPYMQRFI